MSFFESNGQPFGEKFTIQFQIVPETNLLLADIDLEIYRLALKLREQNIGLSFDDTHRQVRQACAEAIAALSKGN